MAITCADSERDDKRIEKGRLRTALRNAIAAGHLTLGVLHVLQQDWLGASVYLISSYTIWSIVLRWLKNGKEKS